MLNSPSVLIANGKKPTNKIIIDIIKDAKNVICVDNGYELASELNITPSVVIGAVSYTHLRAHETPEHM